MKSKEFRKAWNECLKVNALAEQMARLSDLELHDKTAEFKQRLKEGETIDDITVEVFAVVREATHRVLGKRPFDVQIIGGLILKAGNVAEMRTGEGKTITSIAPVYLIALEGRGALVSTVNEYLSERDAEEMGQVHNFLGLTVGVNKREHTPEEKREAYACDITYSTHSEIGFDYLRDNMVKVLSDKVQRGFNFILIDEVDSILIDEARTPLIISGGSDTPSKLYMIADKFVKSLAEDDYEVDLESKAIFLQETGIEKAQKIFGIENLYDVRHSELVHRIQNALRANYIMGLNIDYIVREGKIELVDQFTGRVMEGRSYSEGLQQAIQAKESVEVEPENATYATVTYQNLFRMFSKLCGMTGTGKTEEQEFLEIYNLKVVQIPTNKPIQRVDHLDHVYVDEDAKWKAVIAEIQKHHDRGQALLIGTAAVEKSEIISRKLKQIGLPHNVLNAKNHELEAEIIANAGQKNAITIATNMAGRGTDIKLDDTVKALGGLYVIGTERNESRRVDDQLRGRSGRQGDPGLSRFFCSLDDDLIRRFSAREKLKKTFASFGEKPIKSRMMTRALTRAQVKIENLNFDQRKNVLDYDDVIRQQREVMYAQRDIIIGHTSLLPVIHRMMRRVVTEVLDMSIMQHKDKTLNYEHVCKTLNSLWFSSAKDKLDAKELAKLDKPEIRELIIDKIYDHYHLICKNVVAAQNEQYLANFEREAILNVFDLSWRKHIDRMDKLRSGASLSAYAQLNPLQVYVEKGSELFKDLVKRIGHNVVKLLMVDRYPDAALRKEMSEPSALKQRFQEAKGGEAQEKVPMIKGQNVQHFIDLGRLTPEQRQQVLEQAKVMREQMQKIGQNLFKKEQISDQEPVVLKPPTTVVSDGGGVMPKFDHDAEGAPLAKVPISQEYMAVHETSLISRYPVEEQPHTLGYKPPQTEFQPVRIIKPPIVPPRAIPIQGLAPPAPQPNATQPPVSVLPPQTLASNVPPSIPQPVVGGPASQPPIAFPPVAQPPASQPVVPPQPPHNIEPASTPTQPEPATNVSNQPPDKKS